MNSRQWLVAAILAAALVHQACAQSGPDTVILRDNSVRRGTLQSCDGEVCVLSGSRIGRASIEWIGLKHSPPSPAVRDTTRTEIHLTDGSVVTATRVTVDSTRVLADGKVYSRERVAWIHFSGLKRAPSAAAGPWTGRVDYTIDGSTVLHTGHFDIAVQADSAGKLSGGIKGEETYQITIPGYPCVASILRKLTYDAVLGGQFNRANGSLSIEIVSERTVPGIHQFFGQCGGPPAEWGGSNAYMMYEIPVRGMLGNLTPSADGIYRATLEWRVTALPQASGKASLTLRRADK